MISKSTKPYLVRAIWDWCADNGHTPYLAVQVDEHTRVPAEFVKNGEIVLNISADATHRLTIGNDAIQFAARFGGVSRECSIPMSAVKAIFARENGDGMSFELAAGAPAAVGDTEATSAARPSESGAPGAGSTGPDTPAGAGPTGNGRKSHLQVVK